WKLRNRSELIDRYTKTPAQILCQSVENVVPELRRGESLCDLIPKSSLRIGEPVEPDRRKTQDAAGNEAVFAGVDPRIIGSVGAGFRQQFQHLLEDGLREDSLYIEVRVRPGAEFGSINRGAEMLEDCCSRVFPNRDHGRFFSR